jgi:hypothetical protein
MLHGKDEKVLQNVSRNFFKIRASGKYRRVWEDNIKVDISES